MPDTPSQHRSSIPQTYLAHLATLGDVQVPCKTASDAVLASFCVDKDLSPELVDDILTLLHTHSFDSREVTFRHAQELHSHIAEERRKIADHRSQMGSAVLGQELDTLPLSVRIPPVVLDLVAQEIMGNMPHSARQSEWDNNVFFGVSHERHSPEEADLLAMAQTHRSWTDPATRMLRTRVHIVGGSELKKFVKSPRMGPWIKELYFQSSANPVAKQEDAIATLKYLGKVLQQTPNIEHLAVQSGFLITLAGDDIKDCFQNLMKAIRGMRKLKSLSLSAKQGTVAALPDLCEALSQSPRLEKLDLSNWLQGAGEGLELDGRMARLIAETPSPSRITTLSLAHTGKDDMIQGLVSWLLNSDPSKSALRHLEIHSADFLDGTGFNREADIPDSPWPLQRALVPFMPLVETIRVHCSPQAIGRTAEVISMAKDLKRLSIVGATGFTHFVSIAGAIPAKTKLLHLHFSIYPTKALHLQQSLADKDFMPDLRIVRLTKDPLRFYDHLMAEIDTDGWEIDDVKKLCAQRGVALSNDHMFLSFDELCDLSVT